MKVYCLLITYLISILNYIKADCELGEIWNSDTGKCIKCSSLNKYYQNKSCVTECNLPNRTLYNDTYKICYNCENNQSQFYYNDKCLDSCPTNTIEDRKLGICMECKWLNMYFYQSECKDQCPEMTEISDNNICVNCKDKNKFLDINTGKCVDEKCPFGMIPYNYFFNLCVNCSFTGRYYNQGYCSEYCTNDDEGIILGADNFICEKCYKYGKKSIDGKCVDECPRNSIINMTNSICNTCKSKIPSKFYNKSQIITDDYPCVFNCGSNSANFQTNVCINDLSDYFNPSDCNNGVQIAVNTKLFICKCSPNYYGKFCDKNSTQYQIIKSKSFDYFSKMCKYVINKNESYHLGENENEISDFVKNITDIIGNYPLILNENFNINDCKIYNSGENLFTEFSDIYITKYLPKEDIGKIFKLKSYLQILDALIFYKFNFYWNQNNKNNLPSFFNSEFKIDNLFEDLLSNYAYILQPDYINSIKRTTKLSNRVSKLFEIQTLNYFDFYNYDANNYNMALSSLYQKNKYSTHLKFTNECPLPENSMISQFEWNGDFSYFSKNSFYNSSYFYFGIHNNLGLSILNCQFRLYFSLWDNFKFNFSKVITSYRELDRDNIQPANPSDPFFTNICYSFKNGTNPVINREERIKKYFLNITIKCNVKNFLSNKVTECIFAGFNFNEYKKFPEPYIICECSGPIDSTSYYYLTIEPYDLIANLPNPIGKIWLCTIEDETGLFLNPAFYLINIILVLQITFLILNVIFIESNFLYNFVWIRKHDMDFTGYVLSKVNKAYKRITQKDLKEEPKIPQIKTQLRKNSRRSVVNEKDLSKLVSELHNDHEIFKKNFHLSDYCNLSDIYCIEFDNSRSSWSYLIDYIYDYHFISISLIKFSYFVPSLVRIFNFFLYLLSFYFFMGLLYARQNTDLLLNITHNDVIGKEIIIYGLITSIFAKLVNMFLSILIITPIEMRSYLNKVLFHRYFAIKEFQRSLYESYSYKLVIFVIFNLGLQFLFGLYVLNLNSLKSNEENFQYHIKCCYAILVDFFLISNFIPFLAFFTRITVFRFRFLSIYPLYVLLERWKNCQKYF